MRRLAGFDGLWCVPGSPHHRMDGALLAIHPARERRVPVAHIKQSAISSAKKAGLTRTVHLRIMSPRWRRATCLSPSPCGSPLGWQGQSVDAPTGSAGHPPTCRVAPVKAAQVPGMWRRFRPWPRSFGRRRGGSPDGSIMQLPHCRQPSASCPSASRQTPPAPPRSTIPQMLSRHNERDPGPRPVPSAVAASLVACCAAIVALRQREPRSHQAH